jgi:hypothetical protein
MKKVLISLACLIVLAALYVISTMGNEKLTASDGAAGAIPSERVSPNNLGADITGK